jgi:KDO2-lipid IV(A) lauroyltransferase
MRWPRSPFRDRVEFEIYRAARASVGTLGPRSLSGIGSVLGDLFRFFGRRRSRILRFNLSLAFPEMTGEERRRLERGVARHFGRMILEAVRIQRLSPEELLREVTVEGSENAAVAADLGRGIFYLTGHLGLWEVAALSIGLARPETLRVVNRPLDNPLLEAELARLRGRFGNLALGKQNIVRGVLSQLRDGGAVGMLIDQRVHPDVGVEVPFFGAPTSTHPILARLSARTGAPVVPAAAWWESPGRYTLELREPVVPDRLAEGERDVVRLTARYTAELEKMIRRRPEQWLWYHDRWRDLRLDVRRDRE